MNVICLILLTLNWLPKCVGVNDTLLIKFLRTRNDECLLAGERFWPSFPISRRQDIRDATKQKMDAYIKKNLPNYNVGPKKTDTYNPSAGYEPYWQGGEWAMETPDAKKQIEQDRPKSKEGVEEINKIHCNKLCNPMFIQYGKVCGRNKNFDYKTFDDYCSMGNEDCSGVYGWFVAYLGPCKKREAFITLETRVDVLIKNKREMMVAFKNKYNKEAG